MKTTFSILFIAFSFMFSKNARAQQATDSLKQVHARYISKDLNVTDSKARQVVAILDEYKANAKKVIKDTTLAPDDMRKKLDALIDEKNAKLGKILTEEQLQKIVPTTERRKEKKPGSSTNN